jgi:hypothetical protein
LIAEPNKVWTKNAAVLVVVISRKNFEHNEKYSITHQYDAGAAWENLVLEASSRGLVAHGCKDLIMRKLEMIWKFQITLMLWQ